MNSKSISFTVVFIPEPKGRGYTGYFAEFPELVIAQGTTKEEVEENLFSSLRDILAFNKGEENFIVGMDSKETRNINLVPA